jgi:hypothetical protein
MKEMPDEIRDAISEIVEKGEYDFADNYRWYRVDTLEGFADFQEAESHGCCGSHCETVTIDGVAYMVGFNYGH